MNLQRQEGESELQYQKRLVDGKLVDKTLADIDYSELSELIYGKAYSSDVARRMIYGTKKTLDLMEEESFTVHYDESSRESDIVKERIKLSDQRRELMSAIRSSARIENITEHLVSAAENINSTIGRMYDDEFSVPSYASGCAVLVLSDWHYGMVANNSFNKYNTEIAKDRVKKVVQKSIEKIVSHKCDKLYIIVLGDLIHGAIHTSARVASEEDACDQIMHVSEILAQSIDKLSSYVNETHVHITYGNHARTVQNKKESIHTDNMEKIIPWWISQRLSGNDSITITDDYNEGEFVFVNACGHWICGAHGDLDDVKSSTRILPQLFRKKYGIDIEYIVLGDKHHRESFNELGVTSMICGSLCGADDYSNDHRLYSDPEQVLLMFSEDNGLDAEYHIHCK